MQEYNMLTYVAFRGDLSFRQVPFCDMDAMVLTQLSSVDYSGIVPGAMHVQDLHREKRVNRPTIKQVVERLKECRSQYMESAENVRELLQLVAKSKRYAELTMDGFVRDTDEALVKQFSAITYDLGAFTQFIAFRGTDGYLNSWKEDFNMNYMQPIPSQEDAVTYLEKMIDKGLWHKVMLGGHSKGGNLGVYGATYASEKLKKHMEKIYAFDAPGFLQRIDSEPGYKDIENRICSYVPESCIVGRILEVPYLSTTVKSFAVGVKQHSMFQWKLNGQEYVTVATTDMASDRFDKIIRTWQDSVPREEMKSHVDRFFDIFESNGITNSAELYHMDVKQVLKVVMKATNIAPEDRNFMIAIVRELWNTQRAHKDA